MRRTISATFPINSRENPAVERGVTHDSMVESLMGKDPDGSDETLLEVGALGFDGRESRRLREGRQPT